MCCVLLKMYAALSLGDATVASDIWLRYRLAG